MARIEGMERPGTLLARLAFFLSRRSYGRVIPRPGSMPLILVSCWPSDSWKKSRSENPEKREESQ